MTVRRLLALSTMFVMFHLALVGPANACTEHGVTAGSMSSTTGSDPAMQDHGMRHGGSKGSCGTPISSSCCDALSSCSLTAVAHASGRSLPHRVVAPVLPASESGHLIARALTPEPPPPKA